MKSFSKLLSIACVSAGFICGSSRADIISVNFRISGNDNNSVDADETATSLVPASGVNWNNITLRAAGAGSLENAFDGTLLLDDAGANGATLNATFGAGEGFSEFGDATAGANRALFGEAGLMQSHLNFGAAAAGETITVNDLGPGFTGNGYAVYLYFDLNTAARRYGFTVDDGASVSTFWTADTPTDSDSDDDGAIEWKLATGSTSGSATADANYAMYTGLSGSSFTVRGLSTGGRAILSGFQVVSSIPEPSSAALLVLAGADLLAWRRR